MDRLKDLRLSNFKQISLFLLSIFQVLKEIQSKKELEMVQRIIAQVKAECDATGGDSQRRGYTKH